MSLPRPPRYRRRLHSEMRSKKNVPPGRRESFGSLTRGGRVLRTTSLAPAQELGGEGPTGRSGTRITTTPCKFPFVHPRKPDDAEVQETSARSTSRRLDGYIELSTCMAADGGCSGAPGHALAEISTSQGAYAEGTYEYPHAAATRLGLTGTAVCVRAASPRARPETLVAARCSPRTRRGAQRNRAGEGDTITRVDTS